MKQNAGASALRVTCSTCRRRKVIFGVGWCHDCEAIVCQDCALDHLGAPEDHALPGSRPGPATAGRVWCPVRSCSSRAEKRAIVRTAFLDHVRTQHPQLVVG